MANLLAIRRETMIAAITKREVRFFICCYPPELIIADCEKVVNKIKMTQIGLRKVSYYVLSPFTLSLSDYYYRMEPNSIDICARIACISMYLCFSNHFV